MILIAALILCLSATAAAADPGTIAVALLQAAGVTLGSVGVAVVQIATGLAASAIAQRIRARRQRPSGSAIRTPVTTAGGTVPQTLMLGTCVTGGNIVAPFYAHGEAGKIANAYRTQIIDIADLPIEAVTAVFVDDVRFDVATDLTGPVHPDYGLSPATSGAPAKFAGRFWVKILDGRQTTADPMLVAKYASHPERPWSASHIGTGVAHAILTFRFDSEIWRSEPRVRFEVQGARVYDWRADTTAGGSGPQREDQPATWAWTDNPVVLARAVLRGIPLADGTSWGLGVDPDDLPAAWWTAAATRCDEIVDGAPRYRAGFEVRMATAENGGDTPFDVLDALLEAASAEICDLGGRWIVRVGAPDLPVATITDDDILIEHTAGLTPFPALSERYNAVRASYVSPESGWQPKEAPLRKDDAAIARDGRMVLADLDLPAVWSDGQVQRLMEEWLRTAARWRRHVITLPPDCDRIGPFDVIAWTSAENGYTAKLFEVVSRAVDPSTLAVTLGLREIDHADYDWESNLLLPSPVGSVVVVDPPPASVPGWTVTPVSITDGAGTARRPGIRLSWTPDLPEVTAIRYQIRLAATSAPVADGTTANVDAGEKITADGLVPATAYQVRGRVVIPGRATEWTDWTAVTTPAIWLGSADLDPAGPSIPAGLALTTFLRGDGMAGIEATWTASTAANGLSGYDVQIKQGAGAYVASSTATTRFDWTVDRGQSYSVQVRAVDRLGNVSAWSSAQTITGAADTTPPAVPAGLTATAGFGVIWLNWTANTTDADLLEYEIFESTTTTAPTADTTATFRSRSNSLGRSGLGDGVTRHYWVRAVDTSFNRSAWSSRVQATTTLLVNLDATPGTPGTPTYTTAVIANGRSRIVVSWTAGANADSYELGITRSGGTEAIIAVTGTSYEFETTSGLSFSIRVRSVNKVQNRSAWSGTLSATAATDTTAPATPTGLAATAGFETIWLTWTANAETDFARYEIYESTTTTAPVAGTAATFMSVGPSYARVGLPDSATRHYWVRAVDFSGNKSAWSSRVQATTPASAGVIAADLEGLITATSFASSIKPIEIVSALPTTGLVDGRMVYLTTDKKVYRYRTSPAGWTAEVDGADVLANSITAGQIAAGAIGADQIAANAVTASKVLISDTSNIFPDYDCLDPDYWSSNSAASYSFVGTTASSLGQKFIEVAASVDNEVVLSKTFPVEISTEYLVGASAFLGTGLSGTARIYLDLYSLDATGAETLTRSVLVSERIDVGGLIPQSVSVTTDTTERRARFRALREGGGTSTGRFAAFRMQKKATGLLIVDGAIQANHVSTNEIIANAANIKDGVITNAKIVDLAANKITVAALNAGITIGTTGVTIGTVEDRAADPASVVNAGSTLIAPGKIQISGATGLDSWITPSATTIDGGKITTGSITADQIAAESITASKLKISAGNLFPDYDMLDEDFYTTQTAASYSFFGVSQASTGQRVLSLPVAADQEDVNSGMIALEPDTEYEVSCATWLSAGATGSGTVQVFLQLFTMDSSGVLTYSRAPLIGTRTDSTDKSRQTVTVTTTSTEVRARFLFRRAAGGTAVGRAGGFMVKPKVGGSLIVDGAIVASKLDTGELITLSAQIKDAIVTNAKIGSLDAAKITTGTLDAARIAAGAITTDKIAAGSITASKIRITNTENLFPDFDMIDEAFWSTTTGATYTLTRTANAAFGERYVSISASADTEDVVSGYFPVEPSTEYLTAAIPWVTVADSTMTVFLQLFSVDTTGAPVYTRAVSIAARSGIETTVITGSLVTGSTERRARILLRRRDGGTGSGRCGGIKLQKKATSSLIVDGAITADKVDTTSFSASGLALFGDSLQSTDFSTGVSGWRIQKSGAAEFNDLVVREWIQDGAVSDTVQTVVLGPLGPAAGSAPGTPVGLLDLGSVPRGNIWLRGLVFEARVPSGFSMVVLLQRRNSQLGSAFTSWTTIKEWTIIEEAWAVYSDSGTLSGYHDDFEYRVTYYTSFSTAGDWLRNVYLTLQRITK